MVSSPEGRLASPAGPSSAPVVTASTGFASGRPGVVAPLWTMFQPFQRARGSRGSTTSIELITTLGAPVVVSEIIPATGSAGQRVFALVRPPSAACEVNGDGGLGVRPETALAMVISSREVDVDTHEWFEDPLEQSTPLPLDRLRFSWCRHARTGISVGELLSREHLRPDLSRVRKLYEAGRE